MHVSNEVPLEFMQLTGTLAGLLDSWVACNFGLKADVMRDSRVADAKAYVNTGTTLEESLLNYLIAFSRRSLEHLEMAAKMLDEKKRT